MNTRTAAPLLGLATLAALGLAAAPAHAQTTLTFDQLKSGEDVSTYYNGGFGSQGPGPGPSDGITFVNGAAFSLPNAPSQSNVLFDLSNDTITADKVSGFGTSFAFDYASNSQGFGAPVTAGIPVTVSVFSGIDGTGTLLASGTYADTPNPFLTFVPETLTFSGTAQSVVLNSTPNHAAYDNLTFGAVPTASAAPEPSQATGLGLAVLGFGGLLLRARKRKMAAG